MKNFLLNQNSNENVWKGHFLQIETKISRSVLHRLAMLLMLIAMSLGQVWAEGSILTSGATVYLDISANSGWSGASAVMKLRVYNGSSEVGLLKMTSEGNNIYSCVLTSDITKLKAGRYENESATSAWNESNEISVSSRAKDCYNCVKVPNDGWSNCTLTWGTYNNVACELGDEVITSVLNGEKVMFYYGSPDSWGTDKTLYLRSSEQTSSTLLSSIGTTSYKSGMYLAVGCYNLNSSTTYYLSNSSSWGGNGKSGLKAGCMADMSGDVTSATGGCTFTTTNYSISEGEASVSFSTSVSGNSGIGSNWGSLTYYYKPNSTWEEFDPNNVGSLAVGTYTIYALVSDGHIVVRSTNSATLTVSSAATYTLTVVKGANIASVSGGKADQASVPFNSDISATPSVGYDFAGWTASPAANAEFGNATSASTTVTVKNGSVAVTASAAEHMNTVTIVGGTAASATAGIATTGSATAAEPATGKRFSGWTIPGSNFTLSGCSTNDKTITFNATANGTVTANYEDITYCTLYSTMTHAYAWQDSNTSNKNAVWPGEDMSSTAEVINGTTYYHIDIDEGIGYDKVIFSNNGSTQTGNLDIAGNCGKYYNSAASSWQPLPTPEVRYTVTLVDATVPSVEVGNVIPVEITATDKVGYVFTEWTASPDANVTFADASAKTTNITATGAATVTATYRAAGSTKIYFYNDKDWATVKVHKWGGSLPGTDWPGVAADLESITHDGHKIYSVTITEGEYANVIFNNGNSGDGNQINTVPVHEWTAAKPCLRHTSYQNCEWIALPMQNYQIVYGSKIRVTGNPASGSYIDAGTELTFTAATPDAGYAFAGFFSDGGKTQEITGAGVDIANRTYTVNLNSDIEVHAKYVEIPPDPTLSIAASAAAGTFYTGQTITLTPTTNLKGELTLCWNCVSKPVGATEPAYTPVAESVNFTTSVDKAGEYVFSATIGTGECGGSYELLATAPNCTIQVEDIPYSLYINRDGEKDHSLATGSATVRLAAGKEYTFKIHNGDTWYTNCSSSSDVNVMNATNNLRWPFNNTNGSYADTRVATTIEGDYTFTLTIGESGNRYVSITYPEIAGGKEMYAKAVKDANTDVMIQAFYWAHDGNTATDYTPFGSVKWVDLDGKELGENFDLVWLAPSTVTADYTGYLPMNYSIQGELSPEEETATGRSYAGHGYHSPWGTEAQLKALIANIHTAGGKAIADIVINHSNSDGGSWCTWNTMKFGNSTNNTLYGSYTPDGTWIAANDEMYVSREHNQYGQKENAGECGNMPEGLYPDDWYATYGSTPNGKHWDYSEYNCTYSRDWAHQKREVREMSRAYLLWLKNEIGYDGWRYDFAKGFHGKYINDYNHASGAYFSVAEVFDGDYKVEEGVLADAGNNTYMFDFPGKYNLMNNAIRNGWYQGLQGTAERTLLFGHKKHAVTFVDNHDTFREGYNLSGQANQMPNLGNQVLQANAYILSMPGVPCVFYPYWHEYKNEIKAMIWARRWTGVNSESNVTNEEAADGKYLAVIHGTNGSIWLKLGPKAGVGVCPDGYQCAYTGMNVGVYYKVTDASRVKPMISCDKESQEFVGSIPVTFTAKGANVPYTIYYTINGGAEQTVANGTPITIGGIAAVNDVITVTAYAKSEGGIPSNTLTYSYTKKDDKVTLTATPAAATVGSTVTLTPAAQSGSALNYHFFVKEPGATNFMSCGFTENGAALNYVMAGEGYYQFYVTTTNTDPIYTSNTVRVNAEALVYHLRYKKNDGADDNADNWASVTMSPNGDGTYVYYDADAHAYFSKGANVGVNGTDSDPYFNSEKIANPDNAHDGDNVVWVYNAFEQTLKVNNPAYHVYRIKVTLVDGRDYYSNIIYSIGEDIAVSFYAQTDAELALERYGKNNENKFTWSEVGSIAMPSIASNGVYTTTANVTVTAAHDDIPEVTSCTIGSMVVYEDPYYITTPGQPAEGSQPTMPDYEMTRFDGSHTYYNHYYVAWMVAGQNTYGTVGNNINKNLAGAVGYYKLPGTAPQDGANVRYAYNPATNVFTRTHLAGSTNGTRYLTAFGVNVQDTTSAHNSLTSAINGQTLADASNWVYATAVRVNQTSTGVASAVKLAAQFNGAYTYLLSADGLDSESAKRDLTLADNKLGEYPQFGVVYDYKENRILSGWNPEGKTITAATSVPNVIVTRTNDGSTSEFTISAGQLMVTDHMTTEFVITKSMWTAWTGNQKPDGKKRMFFWFSLPYACHLADVYGFGQCNKDWEVQKYRGDLRAKGTAGESPWRDLYIGSTLEANRGYVLAVDLKESDFKTIGSTSEVHMFFPSAGTVTLTPTTETELADWTTGSAADIQKDWHVMGVPVMKSGRKMVETGHSAAPFELAYRWSWENGGRWYEPFKIVEDDNYFNFQAGHAYMVQGHGDLTWSYDAAGSGSPLFAPARTQTALTNKDMRINLLYEDEVQDKTYVMYRENGKREYEIGRDLEKIENPGRSMIYSELDARLAALCLADTDEEQIPLTIVADETGEYAIALGYELTDLQAVLYDAQNGSTQLLTTDGVYLSLDKGTYRGRFFLGVKKAPNTTTGLNGVGNDVNAKVLKYVDCQGNLRIIYDGKEYDVTGRVIQ